MCGERVAVPEAAEAGPPVVSAAATRPAGPGPCPVKRRDGQQPYRIERWGLFNWGVFVAGYGDRWFAGTCWTRWGARRLAEREIGRRSR